MKFFQFSHLDRSVYERVESGIVNKTSDSHEPNVRQWKGEWHEIIWEAAN